MDTKTEEEHSKTPPNDSGEEDKHSDAPDEGEEEEDPNDSVSRILKQLQSSGALIKKPKEEHRCVTCDLDFKDWQALQTHLLGHVQLPSLVLEKLPSDDELDNSGDQWSDEEDEAPTQKTPQKVDISQLLKNKGIQLKKTGSPLDKLSGLTIKKTPIKEEKTETDKPSNIDLMQRLGQLGGIKLKLKSDGNNTNTFKVVNGLKDFKTSDDEEEQSDNDEKDQDEKSEEENDHSSEAEDDADQKSDKSRKNTESDTNSQSKPGPLSVKKVSPIKINTQGNGPPRIEEIKNISKPTPAASPPNRRPAVKQTPKRGANMPKNAQSKQSVSSPASAVTANTETMPENVVVKKEIETEESATKIQSPIFSEQIKTERSSPPLETVTTTSAPLTATVKTESDTTTTPSTAQSQFSNKDSAPPVLLPVTKKEDTGVTIIEINGDSNDEDDDCCVVSSTPAPEVKPVVPKIESPTYTTPTYPQITTSYTGPAVDSSRVPMTHSTEKQHCFNWNAPDSKPPIEMLSKSADDIFSSLLSSTKKEDMMSSDSEYISLDRLGPQHSCDICNTRFTNVSMLEDHIRTTGHSKSIVAPTSDLLPYNPSSSSILSSLLPVKQLAEQVGKLSTIGGGSSNPFTHQQNVMINIQAYPGAGGMMPPPQSYNAYGQQMPQGYPQGNNMYGQGQNMAGSQYPGQQYMGQQNYGQQYQQQMPQKPPPNYPNTMSPNSYPNTSMSSPYSSSSPLQAMQQSVYGQSAMGMMNHQMGQMGPPAMPTNNSYAPSSSPGGSMKPPMNPQSATGIRIQNVQTFAPGQLTGANGQPVAPGQIATAQSPGQIRVAGPNLAGTRPRMPTVRGARPTLRPGLQVQSQVRGGSPKVGMRMPLKRPAGAAGGPNMKRRPDMLLPGKHDNEDCQVMAMQKQREGLPLIHSVQGAKDKLNLGSQISVTKKTVNREASAMANVLAQRGISIKQKQKSRSPSPERPLPMIPNLGSGVSIKHSSKSSNFSIPEAKVGSGMISCKICKKMFMNSSSLSMHMSNAHPQSKIPMFKCDICPASYPKILQLQHHKRTFHNATGPNKEMGLPVVDMSQTENLKRLSSLGIYSFIPLANREQSSGHFGIPIISVQNMQNGISNGLQALGADGLLSLGPLKPLPNN